MIPRNAVPPLAALFGALAIAVSLPAQAYDYPTVDRVEFVHMCQREHPDKPPHEMLYKCACVIDKLGEAIPYDDFVESSTAYYASTIAGERGQVIRNERVAKALADSFREQLGRARKSCFIN
ncbi:MAG: hypothetical protein NTZ11_18650 [Gammaproteobacteria bacterium]|nr:hypothetical protein [Gammaproteobacteria bacterium]